MKSAFVVFYLAVGCASVCAQPHDLISNLEYRLKEGDLGPVVPGPLESFRGLRIKEGGDGLLAACLAHPEKWSRDPLLYRFGHRQPFSTIGCRERATPSMHMVFYLKPDGSREAWIHFDLHHPHDLLGHSEEVFRNRLTLGHTSQDDVYRSFLQHDINSSAAPRSSTYDFRSEAANYYNLTFGKGAFAGAGFTAALVTTLRPSANWGDGAERYSNRFARNLARHTMQESIEFGASALVRQREVFVVSQDDRIGHRIRSALYYSFFVPGHNGDELAFPRIAAAFGTGFLADQWHPWCRHSPSPWMQTSFVLSSYVAQSFWHEFRPDVKNALKKHFHRN